MDYENKEEGYYNNTREEMLAFLPKKVKTVLDVGCADGSFAETIKNKSNAEVWGIEFMPDEAEKAVSKIDKVFVGPCENHIENLPDNYFDVIYFNDVLEHLVDPYNVLSKIKSKLSKNGVVISSIPNMRYHSALKNLVINKNWEYMDHGIMDKTHLRFFTKKSIRSMFVNADYEIITHKGINATKSIKPWIYNIFFLYTALDIRYLQYATVAKLKS
ncbi:class I SAM-dependent methyltransferase [Flavobacteriaceae bacterium XHP0103]|uniref:class I SAM-dependent methyltransferase n=1 Tax=Marixanthotalea marina TaxID=2844359 RepID=UPI002989E90F|nr:class I SAM-dependent methyltransferase [Marixanthotalea marina]MBU3822409.1 class I SAM-dependent methyltransferase [Marixanthotalea marina]